jgi:hypothetical protein
MDASIICALARKICPENAASKISRENEKSPPTRASFCYLVLMLCRFVSRFSLWHKRRKEKSYQKRNAGDISPSAGGEEGYAPSTAQAFKKA